MMPEDLTGDLAKPLTAERVQLHYAIQFMAAAGMALAAPQPDGSQSALSWDTNLQSFVSQPLGATPMRVGLKARSLTSLILQDHTPVATLALAGKTMAEALHWHQQTLAALGLEVEQMPLLDYPPDDFPAHRLAAGARFEAGDAAARAAIAAYYDITQPLLEAVVAANPAASAIHIWPHHFDLATLLTYPAAEADRFIGVGLSPGDTGYDQPYWYVTAYPYPELGALPRLPAGSWHTQGWVGAVLTAAQAGPAAVVQPFIEAAIAAAQNLLEVVC